MEAPADTNGISRGKAIRINTAVSEKAMAAQWQAAGINEWNIPNPTDEPVAAAYGLSFYSDALPVVFGRVYRLVFDFRGGGGAKVWVRGYGMWERGKTTALGGHCQLPGQPEPVDGAFAGFQSDPADTGSHRDESNALCLLAAGRVLVR